MPYVTSVERIARQEGLEQGIIQGVRETLIETLIETIKSRFNDVPQEFVEKIRACSDIQTLRNLHQQILKADSLADLEF